MYLRKLFQDVFDYSLIANVCCPCGHYLPGGLKLIILQILIVSMLVFVYCTLLKTSRGLYYYLEASIRGHYDLTLYPFIKGGSKD